MRGAPRTGAARRAVLLALAAAFVFASVPPAHAESVADQLARLKKEVRQAGRDYERAADALEASEFKLEKLDRQLAATEQELSEARSTLSDRVAIMYRNSTGLGILDVILAADSYEDMQTRLDFLYRIGRADAGAVARVESLQARLAAQRASIASEKKNLQAATAARRKANQRLQSKLASKQAQYEALQKRASGSSSGFTPGIPKGSLGWVFPVQGACYYGNTWGAPRSGGRTHKGTDIMAKSGTPCVATLSGTVKSKEGGLGGKTIWLKADNGDAFYYAHLAGWAVRSGRVKKGQLVGYVGDTGNARGGAPHLHFEYHPGGGFAANPYPYLRACE